MKTREALRTIKPYVAGALKPGAIKLASNENPLGPSPRAMEAIARNASGVSLYPDALATELREKLAGRLGVSADQLLVGNGSDEILLFIAGAYIEAGDEAVTSQTTFSEYTFATTLFGGTMRYAPMEDGRFQLNRLLELIGERTRIVFLCNPNNPTGTIFSGKELEAFLERVPRDVLVVSDEAYFEYVSDPSFPDSIALQRTFPDLLVLRTFSKIYGLAGLRVGYGIGSEAVIGDLRRTKEPFNVNILAQAAALAALDDEEFLRRSLRTNEEGKIFLMQELGRMGIPCYPTEANFICCNIGRDGMEAFRRIMDLGVTIRPLASFGLTEWIRVTIGTPEQNRTFLSCLKAFLEPG